MVLFLLLILNICQGSHSDCILHLKYFLQLPEAIQWTISSKLIGLSGSWANKFGYYDRCLQQNNHYSTVVFKASPLDFEYGLCHSNRCTAEDLNSSEAQKLIKDYLSTGQFVKTFQINIYESKMQFYNPITYYPNFGIETIITISIIIILILIGIVFALIQLKLQKKQENNTFNNNNNNQNSKIALLTETFSLKNNYLKLFTLKTQDPNLSIFNGIRTLAFIMVIYGHSTLLIVESTYKLELATQLFNWKIIFAIDMLYSVDIFFWIGGFFMGYVMTEKNRKRNLVSSPFAILTAILHRLLRIWPSYIICIMINSYIIPFMGQGPRWWQAQNFTGCPAGSWRNLIFIDNFFHDWQLCFGWGWYLTSDVQLFIICLIPIIVYSLGYEKQSKIIILLLLISSSIYGFIICYTNNFLIPIRVTQNIDFYYSYYVNCLARSPPYFFGLFIGMLYREFKTEKIDNIFQQIQNKYAIKKPKYFQFFCYILGGSIILWLCIGWKIAYKENNIYYWSATFQQIYESMCRLLFVFGVTLICLPNMIGIYDIFNQKIMNTKFCQFMAKISFTGYLLHYMFLLILSYTFYITPSYTNLDVIQLFIGCLFLTIISAIFLSLFVEIPFGQMQTKLLQKLQQKKKKKEEILLIN